MYAPIAQSTSAHSVDELPLDTLSTRAQCTPAQSVESLVMWAPLAQPQPRHVLHLSLPKWATWDNLESESQGYEGGNVMVMEALTGNGENEVGASITVTVENIVETVNVNSESNDNGGRQIIEKRMSLPHTVTLPPLKTCTTGTRLESLWISIVEDNTAAGVLREGTVCDNVSWVIAKC